MFMPLKFSCERPYTEVREGMSGGILTKEEYENGITMYGSNIIEVEDKGIDRIFLDEVITPFYVFQVCFYWNISKYIVVIDCQHHLVDFRGLYVLRGYNSGHVDIFRCS